MKPLKLILAAAVALAVLALLTAWTEKPVPPVPQSDEGVIVYMDYASKRLTLASSECGMRVVYSWSESTRFMRRGLRAGPEQFEPGMEVLVYYDTIAARSMLREVIWKKDPIYVSVSRPTAP